jgi:hypothetical protein
MSNTPPSWTDKLLIREIRAGGKRRDVAWEYVYKAWRGIYLSPVLKQGGNPEQADEVLGRVFVDVEKQILRPDFELQTAKLSTYLTDSVQKAWKWARKHEAIRKNSTVELDYNTHLSGHRKSVEDDFVVGEYLTLFEKLGEKCKTVLTMHIQGYSMREIASEIGFQNEQSAKNEKRKCHLKLLDLTNEH